MPENLKFTILGCGGSAGVPAAGNHWGVCDPDEPKNRRSRCCLLVESSTTTIVIDTGPEFREQMNRANVQHLDAVFYTHHHSDHVDGVSDLRSYRFRGGKLVPVYLNAETLERFGRSIPHMLEVGEHDIYPPILETHVLGAGHFGRDHQLGDIAYIPFEQDHGTCKSIGYRFGELAYSVDMLDLDDAAIQTLKGVQTWVVDGAGYKSGNVVHANLDKLYALNEQIGAKDVIITSLTPAMDYQTMAGELPPGYRPAYDGLSLLAG